MKTSLTSILIRGFLRNRGHVRTIAMAIMVTMFLLPLFSYYASVVETISTHTYETDCGTFDLVVEGLTNEEQATLLADEQVADSCGFSTKETTDPSGRPVTMIGSTDNFTVLAPYTLLQGHFPATGQEILCEPWYLRQQGISTGEMIGSSLTVDGATFTVVGTISFSGYSTETDRNAVLVFHQPAGTDSLYLDLSGSGTQEEVLAFAQSRLEMDRVSVGWNVDKQIAYETTETGARLVLHFIFFVALASCLIVLAGFSIFFLQKNEPDLRILSLVGVAKNKILLSLVCFYTLLLLVFGGLGVLLFLFLFCWLLPVCGFSVSGLALSVVSPGGMDLLGTFALLFLSEWVVFLFTVIRMLSRSFSERKGKKKTDAKPRQRKRRSRFVFLTMARQNIKISSKVSAFTILSVSVCGVLLTGISFYLDCVSAQQVDYGDTRFLVSFEEDGLLTEEAKEEKSQLIAALLNDEALGASIQNVYLSTAKVNKDLLSREFKDYLSHFPSLNGLLNNSLTREIPIPVGLISAAELEGFDGQKIEDGTGVLYVQPCNLSGVGFDVEGETQISLRLDTQETRTVSLSREEWPLTVYTNEVYPLLVVSEADFIRLSHDQKTSDVFLSGSATEDELLRFTAGKNFVRVQNVMADKILMDSGSQTIRQILSALFFVCLLSVAATLTVTCLLRLAVFRKEYATLNAIGVPLSTVMRIPVYEYGLIFLPILLVSALGTFFVSKVIVFLMDSVTVDRLTPFPGMTFLAVTGCQIVVFGICVGLVMRAMKKQTSAALLVKR